MPDNIRNNPKILASLANNKVLNKDVRLEDIIKVSSEMAGMVNEGDLAAWTFISPSYVYTGDNAQVEVPEIRGTITKKPVK